MDFTSRIKALRESTGMNRKEFCEYFQIPYRTVTEWERDNRHAPEYVLRLLEYYIRMEKLQKEKSYTIPSFLLEKIQEVFAGYWTDEEECAKTIYDTYKESDVLIDPHTSVALSVCKKYQSEGNNEPCIILSTASPYKFSKDVLKALHVESEDGFEAMHTLHKMTDVPVPANLQTLESLPVRFTRSIEKSQAMDVIAERMKEIGHDHH